MTALARYASLWFAQIRYSTVREMMFKANFLLWVITDLGTGQTTVLLPEEY